VSRKRPPGRRGIDLPAFLCEILEDQFSERSHPRAGARVRQNPGNPPHLSSFRSQTWKKAREKISRPDFRWHDLRHASVALRIANGAHPKTIQERMGHSSIMITLDRYGHQFPSLGIAVADGLDATYRAALTGDAGKAATVTNLYDIRRGNDAKGRGDDVKSQQITVTIGKGRKSRIYHLTRIFPGGGARIRTGVRGFAGPCLNHSATPP
jgi:hypothetical protein